MLSGACFVKYIVAFFFAYACMVRGKRSHATTSIPLRKDSGPLRDGPKPSKRRPFLMRDCGADSNLPQVCAKGLHAFCR